MRNIAENQVITPQRKIVVFYTYKGGIGRSMSLVNCAWRSAVRHGLRVIVVDWDLEAPSLDQYFCDRIDRDKSKKGLVDYLLDWHEPNAEKNEDLTVPGKFKEKFLHKVKGVDGGQGEIWLMSAGHELGDSYGTQLKQLMGKNLLSDQGIKAITTLRNLLASNCDVALIDSRTGLTDIGYVCTSILPDAVFMLTAANEQSWTGLLSAASNARPRPDASSKLFKRLDRDATRTVWLGVSRVPLVGELTLTDDWLRDNQKFFDDGIDAGYWDDADHPDGLRTFLIPHNGRWTVGQRIVRPPDAAPDDYLSVAFDRIAEAINVWHRKPRIEKHRAQEPRYSLGAIRDDIHAAMRRRDYEACAQLYYLQGAVLCADGKLTESMRAFESATLLALGRQDMPLYALSLDCLAKLMSSSSVQEPVGDWNPAGLRKRLNETENVKELERKKTSLLARTGLPGPDELGHV